MTPLLECPACEAEIPAALASNSQCCCPYCKFTFPCSSAVIRSPESPSTIPLPTDALPVPKKVAALRGRADAPAAPTKTENNSQHVVDQPADEIAWLNKSSTTHDLPIRPVNKNRAGLLLLGVCLAALLVGGIGLLALSQRKPKSQTVVPSSPQPKLEVAVLPANQPAVTPSAPSPDKKIDPSQADLEKDWERLTKATREEYYSLWSKVGPYLVRLDIQSPNGNRTAAGVIVDSRGFVATSYGAIADAISIKVRAGPKALATGDPFGELADDVRGLLAADPAHDLALLQINRRFVSTFADVALVPNGTTLPGERLVVAAPPSEHRLWLVDFPILQVQPWPQLFEQFQTPLTRLQLDASANTSWIAGSVPSERFVPGAPVFDFDGQLVGLLTAVKVIDSAIAGPGGAIATLKRSANGSPKPFPIDTAVAERMANEAEATMLLPAVESPAFAPAKELLEAMRAIDANEVITDDPQKLASLGHFADALLKVDDFLDGGQLSDEQSRELRNFLAEILDRLQPIIEHAVEANADKLAAFNELVWENIETEAGFLAVGKVFRQDDDVDRGGRFVIFQLDRTDYYLFTTARFDGPLYYPGSRWLLIGRHVPKVIYKVADGESQIDARACETRYVIALDPLENK
jgi:uncharacterized membrane protein